MRQLGGSWDQSCDNMDDGSSFVGWTVDERRKKTLGSENSIYSANMTHFSVSRHISHANLTIYMPLFGKKRGKRFESWFGPTFRTFLTVNLTVSSKFSPVKADEMSHEAS
jgi:hypothetical protein